MTIMKIVDGEHQAEMNKKPVQALTGTGPCTFTLKKEERL